jgi:hypothetical protein
MKRIAVVCLILLMNFVFGLTCFADTVIYNTKTGKYHSATCQWAAKCTANCIKIDRKEAIKRNGVPCKVCGAR